MEGWKNETIPVLSKYVITGQYVHCEVDQLIELYLCAICIWER